MNWGKWSHSWKVRQGRVAEGIIFRRLRRRLPNVARMKYHHPFDILVGTARIEVKQRNPNKSGHWTFPLPKKKSRRNKIDFYVFQLDAKDRRRVHVVIPSPVSGASITITRSDLKGKFAHCIDNWGIINGLGLTTKPSRSAGFRGA